MNETKLYQDGSPDRRDEVAEEVESEFESEWAGSPSMRQKVAVTFARVDK